MAREPSLNLPNPWAAVGRDTEGGRALFALYNGYNHARSRGNDYSQINKLKTLRYIATHGLPEFPVLQPPPPKKIEVKVPHFSHNHGYNPNNEFHPIDFIPRRRRASKILQQIRDDSYEVELPPMPKGPLLDDAEKARLQEVFYWSNRHVGPDDPVVAEPVRRVPKRGSIEEQELLLNTIAGEIEDREAFLNEMEAYGKGEQYRSQIMFEIQQRVGQMKLLHENITKIEKRENENCQPIKTKSTSNSSYTAPSKNLYARGQGRNANTISLRCNPSIASMQGLHEDPRFGERSSTWPNGAPPQTLGNQHETLTTQPVTNPWRIDTPDSLTPNVIRTVACCATTPRDATATSIAEPQPPRNSRSNSCCNSKKVSKAGHSMGKSPDFVAARSPLTSSSSSSDPCGRFANTAHPQRHSGNSEYTISATSANYPSKSTPGNGECSLVRDCSPLESPHNFSKDRDMEYPLPGY